MPAKPITAAELNQIQQKHWEERTSRFNEASKNKTLMATVRRDYEAFDVQMKLANTDVQRREILRNQPPMDQLVEAEKLRMKTRNQVSAKRIRPKPKATLQSLVIEAMRKSKAQNRQLKEFLQDVSEHRTRKVRIKLLVDTGKYEISVNRNRDELSLSPKSQANENDDPSIIRAFKTLEDWWMKASEPKKILI